MSDQLQERVWSVIRQRLSHARALDDEHDSPERIQMLLDYIAALAADSILDLYVEAGFNEGQA